MTLRVSSSVEKSIANLMKAPELIITCTMMNNNILPNINDCGLYAIAFAVSIAFDKDPTKINFTNNLMCGHFLLCIQNGYMEEFPHSIVKRSSTYTQVHTIYLHCTCRMPELGYMFQCTTCNLWFHPECQEIKLSKK